MIVPTPEQERAIEAFSTGDPLVITAGAGTGKTSTLDMLARSTPRNGVYIAFNRSIANEANARFPLTVDARTMHSFAMRAVGDALNAGPRLRRPLVSSAQTARVLGLGPIMLDVDGRRKVMQPSALAGHVMRAIQTFCRSADPHPDVHHFRRVPAIDPPGGPYRNNLELAAELLPQAEAAWLDLLSPNGRLRFTHDVYVKTWERGRYKLPGDYILHDEAQDANPVALSALAHQDHQIVHVGDANQCIYEWRGAAGSFDGLAGHRSSLTQSFRFGPRIAEIANVILDLLGAELRLVGTDTIRSSLTHLDEPAAWLSRTNAGALDIVLREQKAGRSVHLVGNADEAIYFVTEAAKLQAGQASLHPDLVAFGSWREVQDYVENDPGGDDLRTLVYLIDNYGAQIIIDALEGQVPEGLADVVVSTAHKAKGREWPSVRLAGDFDPGDDSMADPELRLLYVACTRAQYHLDVTSCPTISEMLVA